MIPVEIELKWRIAAVDYPVLTQRLAELLGPPRRLEQENRFYDAADGRLRQARRSVRLRRENGRVVLTCKAKGTVDALGTHRHDEWEAEVGPTAWAANQPPLPLPSPWHETLAGAALIALGGFANLRLEWHDGPHLLCLDRTDLGARIDYELEIETPEPAAAATRWRDLLAAWAIAWCPEPDTKLQRWAGLLRNRP